MTLQPPLKKYQYKKLKSEVYNLYISKKIFNEELKDQLNFYMLKYIFMSNNNYKNRFINLIDTQQELSLILDKNIFNIFMSKIPEKCKNFINYDKTTFKILEIYTLENEIYVPGTTSYISSIMAENNIPILYINSFNNNYILIPETYFIHACNIIDQIAEQDP